MKTLVLMTSVLFATMTAQAFGPDLDAVQMQRLIETSQQQLKVAQELLKQAKQDSSSMDRAAGVLDQLAKGLDQKIQGLQGTKVYDEALLKLQESGSSKFGAAPVQGETGEQASARQNFYQFQQESLKANREDMSNQKKMAEALANAQPGFVPKIQAQAAIGQWQSNTRLSAQLTELLAAVQALRQDLGSQGPGGGKPSGFGLFLSGSAEQTQKQQGRGVNNVP